MVEFWDSPVRRSGGETPEIKLNTFAYLTGSFACNFADKRSEYAT